MKKNEGSMKKELRTNSILVGTLPASHAANCIKDILKSERVICAVAMSVMSLVELVVFLVKPTVQFINFMSVVWLRVSFEALHKLFSKEALEEQPLMAGAGLDLLVPYSNFQDFQKSLVSFSMAV